MLVLGQALQQYKTGVPLLSQGERGSGQWADWPNSYREQGSCQAWLSTSEAEKLGCLTSEQDPGQAQGPGRWMEVAMCLSVAHALIPRWVKTVGLGVLWASP